MKTTLEIPDDLFREAKAKAAMEGKKLKDLVSEGLRIVVHGDSSSKLNRHVEFPLIRRESGTTVKITEEKIAELQALEDAKEYGRFMRRKPATRSK